MKGIHSAYMIATRLLMAAYLGAWLLFSTSMIGEQPSLKPVSWASAWTFWLAIAGAAFIGWMARGEHERFKRA